MNYLDRIKHIKTNRFFSPNMSYLARDNYCATAGNMDHAIAALRHHIKYEEGTDEYLRYHPGTSPRAIDDAKQELEYREAMDGAYDSDIDVSLAQFDAAWEIGNAVAESPIERTILPALIIGNWAHCEHSPAKLKCLSIDEVKDEIEPSRALIVPQLKIGNYRADFAVAVHENGQNYMIIVECDGREFHGNESDRERDRFMWNLGFPTIRLTGSEIHKNPFYAVLKAIEIMDGLIYYRGKVA